jgi:hypothetical protein
MTSIVARFAVALATLFLLGNQPRDCPPFHGFDATVVAAERPSYACALPITVPASSTCLETSGGAACSGDRSASITFADSASHTLPLATNGKAAACDLPSGPSTVSLCTPGGTLTCQVVLQKNALTSIGYVASLPHRHRYVVRADQPIPGLGVREVTVDSDEHDLAVGQRWRFQLFTTITDDASQPRTSPLFIGPCQVRPVSRSAQPAQGCAHCSGSEPGGATLAVLLIIVVACVRWIRWSK